MFDVPEGTVVCTVCSRIRYACLKVKVSDTLLVAEVLSLQGNDIVGSSSLKCKIQTLDLVVSQLHLKNAFQMNGFVI